MSCSFITQNDIEHRSFWVNEICRLSGDFGAGSERVELMVSKEIKDGGISRLINHLRLCGAIPERYDHDSTEEKLYSKYTDVVIHEAYSAIGFTSLVLKERADVADVECTSDAYDFVADAKAFRLSRTAKNQKDFKVQAMDNWKHGKPFAMVVCPVYQLPNRSSQIYQQAAARSVCIATYTHLAVLVRFAELAGGNEAQNLLHSVFKAVEAMNPSKDATSYWQVVNRVFLNAASNISEIWREEKMASSESILISRAEALRFLAEERARIMKLSREEAVKEVINSRKLDTRIQKVKSVVNNELLNIGSR